MDINNILSELQAVDNLITLEDVYKKFLGKNGIISAEFKTLKDLSPEEKKQKGQELSDIKNKIESVYKEIKEKFEKEEINKQLSQDLVDTSIEIPVEQGHYSLLAKARREIEEICQNLGFIVEYGKDVVTKFENFESVNIPLTHPATEMHDTIYLKNKDQNDQNLILRTHTSSMQNMLIKKHGLPIKVAVPYKTYRYENIDATHDTMFYQLEGVYIDKNISIANLKDTLTKLLSAILHKEVEIRMRPAYFPFVEPGIEVDARYYIKDPKTGEKTLSDWIEILGAGMIHPNVLKEADIDPEQRQGFAFGIGINRVVAIRHGIKDIRYFNNGDLRFVRSF